jgi:hypothetical protein
LGACSLAGAAHADVTISKAATTNMNCTSGVCKATAKIATLKIDDLETMLASSNVKVTTSGALADNIVVGTSITWVSANRLSLDAYDSITIVKPIADSGTGALSLVTNDGGSKGTLVFGAKGNVTLFGTDNVLSINNTKYKLVNSVASLATAVAGDASGAFALAVSYDASKDGTYSGAPVLTEFRGTFEGLGNTISNLRIFDMAGTWDGLFQFADRPASFRDIGLPNAQVENSNSAGYGRVGALVAINYGAITRSYATGAAQCDNRFWACVAGGLAGLNYGPVNNSWAAAAVAAGQEAEVGGLIGNNHGPIDQSFATGSVSAYQQSIVGGLVGNNVEGTIENTWASGAVSGQDITVGGLVGANGDSRKFASSYATGVVTGTNGSTAGGLLGYDSQFGLNSNAYWDTDMSGITNPGQGAGIPSNDPGVTGLTTQQFQSGLPPGFNPKVWAEAKKVNNGMPYLAANPPQ